MIHYVKEKKRNCTFPIYSIIVLFIFIQLVFTLFVSSQVVVCLSIVYFIYVYLPRGTVQCVLGCSLLLHFCDCHFSLKALLGTYDRMS